MDKYTADFETTTDKNDCRVWAWGIQNIYNDSDFTYGNTIESFFNELKTHVNSIIYFHNLKFDGEFIIYYLLTHNFQWTNNRHAKAGEFKTLISGTNQFYSIEIQLEQNTNIKIYDSLKILPFSVDKIAKDFKLPINKLKIDYNKYRPINHKITNEELEYLKHDCKIMGLALYRVFEQGNTQMTAGSNALKAFKATINNWKDLFPILSKSTHNDILLAYKGGYTYCNKVGVHKNGIVLDVNSLYPDALRNNPMPYGKPIFFEGKYQPNKDYPLYIQQISCQFELKNGFLPTVQLKHNLSFMPVEYLKTSNDEIVVMTMTNIDLEIFLTHYDTYNLEYLQGYMFKSINGVFNEYIDNYMAIKENSSGALRTLAKLMLNSLYGKFGTGIDVTGKHPEINEKTGGVKYVLNEKEEREPIYLPVAVFTTAYARKKTITSAQKVYDRFIYADTDSLHLDGWEVPKDIEVHPAQLGKWKLENRFTKAKFIKPKTYLEIYEKAMPIEYKEELHINNRVHTHKFRKYETIEIEKTLKCCGMPDNVKKEVTWENFKIGFNSQNKLMPEHVKGGIILTPGLFQIR